MKLPANSAPGSVAAFDGRGLIVNCGEGAYRITRLKPAGRQEMSAADFFNGRLRNMDAPYGMLGAQATKADGARHG